MEFSKSKADINEVDVVWPQNGYSDLRKRYENQFFNDVDHHTGLSLLSVTSQIESFIGEEEA